MIIVKATKDSEAGALPSEELLTAMGRFNEELAKAGILLAGDGLQPSSKGARVRFSGPKRTVVDGPFAETKELIAGFWIWKCKSMQEAIEFLSTKVGLVLLVLGAMHFFNVFVIAKWGKRAADAIRA